MGEVSCKCRAAAKKSQGADAAGPRHAEAAAPSTFVALGQLEWARLEWLGASGAGVGQGTARRGASESLENFL